MPFGPINAPLSFAAFCWPLLRLVALFNSSQKDEKEEKKEKGGEGGERAAQEDFPRRRIHSGDSLPFWAIEARSGACGTRSKRDRERERGKSESESERGHCGAPC